MKKNTPSATAALILKVVLFEAYDKAHPQMISHETTELNQLMAQKIVKYPNFFSFVITNSIFRLMIKVIEKILNPGFILHVSSRKKYIAELSKKAINQGYKQIIILGAGYDTLGLRIARANKEVTCFELDHPNTQELKTTSLTQIDIPANFNFTPADLATHTLTNVLQQNPKFNSSKKTLVIIEGVLMYLQEQDVAKLFKELLSLFPHGLQCIFTFMERRPNGDIQFKTAHPIVNWWLKKKNEQFHWGIAKDDLISKVEKIGFKDVLVIDKNDFIKEYFSTDQPAPQLAEGEMICSMRT